MQGVGYLRSKFLPGCADLGSMPVLCNFKVQLVICIKNDIFSIQKEVTVMIVRKIQKELAELAREYKVITITGPRQSGKTTLARMQFPDYDYVNMESPEIRQLAEQDAREFLKRHPAPLIIDEIQRLPMLLSYIQVKCDQSRQKGQYILTGSHQPAGRTYRHSAALSVVPGRAGGCGYPSGSG